MIILCKNFVRGRGGWVIGGSTESEFVCTNYLNCLIGKKWTYRIAIDTQYNRDL